MKSVYSAVRTGSLKQSALRLYKVKLRSEGTPSVHEPSLKIPTVRHRLNFASLFQSDRTDQLSAEKGAFLSISHVSISVFITEFW
jgi:hypothetical protein